MNTDNSLELEKDSEKVARYLASFAPALLEQAREKLENRLQSGLGNGKLWLQLGNIYRGLGELQRASDAFKKAERFNHEPDLCRYLMSLCSQVSPKLTYPETDFTPSPFLRSLDFLTDEELAIAWEVFRDHACGFETSQIGKKQVRETTRASVVLRGSKFNSLRKLFKARIEPICNRAFETFDIEPPSTQKYDVQMTSHANSEFYRTHTDIGPNHARVLSFVYYFHKQPKAFTGGELQLFDTNIKLNTASTTMTTIEPIDNSLIIFPSNYYHQVCTVNMQIHERIWGRHTINGWLIDAEKQAEIDALRTN